MKIKKKDSLLAWACFQFLGGFVLFCFVLFALRRQARKSETVEDLRFVDENATNQFVK